MVLSGWEVVWSGYSVIFIHESKISRNRKCNNQIYDFLGTILELDEDYIC